MNRREFLQSGSAAAALISAHFAFPVNANQNKRTTPLIRSITLLTNSPIAHMKEFYVRKLGFGLIEDTDQTLTISAGSSTLSFAKVNSEARPFYHFAFNIPENKIQEAFEWQRTRTPVVHPSPNGNKDAIVHFPGWDAHSIFFLDPAGNLVEYIARHALNNSSNRDFSIQEIQCISEIGFIVDDVETTGKKLMQDLNLVEYRPRQNSFWPIGDEMGLLLMIGNDRVWSSNPGQTNKVGIFKTSVKANSNGLWESDVYPYEVTPR